MHIEKITSRFTALFQACPNGAVSQSLQLAAITIRVGRSCSTGLARIYMCVGANADINSNTNTDIITNLDEQK